MLITIIRKHKVISDSYPWGYNFANFRFSRERKALYMRNSKETLELHRPRDVTFMYRIVLLFENMFVQNFEHLLLIDSLKLWFSKCTECMKNGRPSKVFVVKKKFSPVSQVTIKQFSKKFENNCRIFIQLSRSLRTSWILFSPFSSQKKSKPFIKVKFQCRPLETFQKVQVINIISKDVCTQGKNTSKLFEVPHSQKL